MEVDQEPQVQAEMPDKVNLAKSIKCIRRFPGIFRKPYCHVIYNQIDSETQEKYEAIVPLKNINLNCVIQEGLATMDLQMDFTNSYTEEPVEVTLEFPCDKNTLVTKMMAQVDDRVVEAKVEKKEKAEQKYDDAVASGNAAALVQTKKNDDGFTLKLGNLSPGKTAVINVQLSKMLEIEGGSYAFRLPSSYFPDYDAIEKQKIGIAPKYTFSYNLEVKSFKPITYLSTPSNSQTEVKVENKHIIVKSEEGAKAPKRDQMLYFKVSDMGLPSLKVQYSEKYPDHVALLASFVPTFEQKQPQESMELFENEVPEIEPLNPNQKFLYTFIVDRSGSMSGGRMRTTVEALQLFLKSLPAGCAFQITSFGSRFDSLEKNIIQYNDQSKTKASIQVGGFSANYGGTDIYSPLRSAMSSNPAGYSHRIFLLTDGQVGNVESIVNYVGHNTDRARVHTFGIGSGCDRNLVKLTASAGRGTASFADDGTSDLRGLVIKALKNASEESLRDCQLQWGDFQETEKLGELFRNELVTSARIVTKQEFEKMTVKFTSTEEPIHKTPIEVQFEQADFEAMPEGDILFKHAANLQVKNTENQHDEVNMTNLALKYQIMSNWTSMVAVVKQKEKATGEMKEFKIPFGSKITVPDIIPVPQYSMYKPQQSSFGGFGGNSAMRSMPCPPGGGAASFGGQMKRSKAKKAAPQGRGQPPPQGRGPPPPQGRGGAPQGRRSSNMEAFGAAQNRGPPPPMAVKSQAPMAPSQGLFGMQAQMQPQMAMAQSSSLFGSQAQMQPQMPMQSQAPMAQSSSLFGSQAQMQPQMAMAQSLNLFSSQAQMQPTQQKESLKSKNTSFGSQQMSAQLDQRKRSSRMASSSDEDMAECEDDEDDQFKDVMMKSSSKQESKILKEESKQAIEKSEQSIQPKKIDLGQPAPSFDELINAQESSGSWNANCSHLLVKFFSEPMTNDKLFDELKAINESQVNQIWHTILALFILNETFDDRADEWEMIARKAKTWLKQQGVAKPDSFINKITLTLK